MGQVFRHVADVALQPSELGTCQLCGRVDVPSYDYQGEIIHPDAAADPQLARDEPEVCCLCADCLHSGHVRRDDDAAAQLTVAQAATASADPDATRQALWHGFHQLPDAPLFLQGFDWPICCGDWCEFTGSPHSLAELLAAQRSHGYWQIGLGQAARDFAQGGPPESLREVSLFRCLGCGQGLYTDQFT